MQNSAPAIEKPKLKLFWFRKSPLGAWSDEIEKVEPGKRFGVG